MAKFVQGHCSRYFHAAQLNTEEHIIFNPTVNNFYLDTLSYISKIQDLFHVYLNKFEFHFLRLPRNETNRFCFLINNGRVTGTTK